MDVFTPCPGAETRNAYLSTCLPILYPHEGGLQAVIAASARVRMMGTPRVLRSHDLIIGHRSWISGRSSLAGKTRQG